jgi:4-amino-4-deoxy-L-arabinose transferase-like glycosyltransferase
MWGDNAGVLALIVYVLDPTITGHGHLVTTDMGFTLGMVMSLWTLWHFLERRTTKNAALFGLSFGLMLLTKYSSLLVAPICFVLVVFYLIVRKVKLDAKQAGVMLAQLVMAGFISWAVVIAGYGFDFSIPRSALSPAVSISGVNHIESPVPDTEFVGRAYEVTRHVMVPEAYFHGLFSFVNHATFGHDSYLFGKISLKGWWYYFPVLLSAKWLTAVSLLIVLSLVALLLNPRKNIFGTYLLVAAVLYLGFSMTSNVNIGVRHVMPVFALVALLVGSLVAHLTVFNRYKRPIALTVLVLVIMAFLEFVSLSPYYLSYFNQWYGGTGNGYRVAVDSNLDWGQDLYRIKKYLNQHPEIQNPYMEYFWAGSSSLSHQGVSHRLFADFDPAKDEGFIIISASSLVEGDNEWLREQSWYDRISPSVFVYKIAKTR